MTDDPMSAAIDYAALGNLIKSWVLGEDRLKKPDPANPGQNLTWPKPVSATDAAGIAALQRQFDAAGTHFTIAPTVTELVVVESSETRFVLKLPSATAIRKSEALLSGTGTWRIPAFYDAALSRTDTPSVEDKFTLDAQRIGDYTISNCAG